MILGAREIVSKLRGEGGDSNDPFFVAPAPDLTKIENEGGASLDLRLGTWFVTTKLSRHTHLDIHSKNQPHELDITTRHYVPFGHRFILHPRSFVLATTLEWIRMPRTLGGYVTGKSSWGRRGLVIETAPGVHPGFAGCLTLELANVGELPIVLMPGTTICQLFLHEIKGPSDTTASSFLGFRQPLLGQIKPDEFVSRLVQKGSLFD
ncbi:MAG TPA: dCTP deaminase [Novimethylophilus sp.]|jgi:dCTP deaminase|uniref:dCTP deaminase n=1 Tax=Novimethylophilus sp. TaxID=2137426 RepID=UPI002F3F881A